MEFTKFQSFVQLEQHRKLFSLCFPEVYCNSNYSEIYRDIFIHLYHNFPGEPSSYQYAALDRDQLVGYYAAIPYKYKIDNENINIAMVCGVMTDPRVQKSGIFSGLGKYASNDMKAAGIKFEISYPIRKAVIPGLKKIGFEPVFELPLFIRFLKATSLLKKRRLSAFAPFANLILSVFNSISNLHTQKKYKILSFDSIDQINGYDKFLHQWNNMIRNSLIKDKTFLKWRYGSPGKKYIFLCAYYEDSLVGLVSLREIIREGVPSYGVLDFSTIDRKCLSDLHYAIYKQAKTNNVEAILAMMSNYSALQYNMTKYLYLKSPYRFSFMINILDKDIDQKEIFEEKNWHLMFVDSDDL